MYTFIYRILILLSFSVLPVELKVLAGTKTLSELELSKIISQQARLHKEANRWSEAELTRQAQEIINQYESYLVENPNDINALILFGKFLRKTNQREEAVRLFLKANEINPNIAVIKKELGNYLVENNQAIEAFPLFLMTTRLEPDEPFYHHNLGSFLFYFQEQLTILNEEKKVGLLMHESFKEAARLDPGNFDYQLRYAQSFFDFNASDKNDALIAWEVLIKEFGKRSKLEMDYLKLGKARVLIDLKRHEEAIPLLNTIDSSSVLNQKESLLKNATEKKIQPSIETETQSPDTKPEQYIPVLKSSYNKIVPSLSDPILKKNIADNKTTTKRQYG